MDWKDHRVILIWSNLKLEQSHDKKFIKRIREHNLSSKENNSNELDLCQNKKLFDSVMLRLLKKSQLLQKEPKAQNIPMIYEIQAFLEWWSTGRNYLITIHHLRNSFSTLKNHKNDLVQKPRKWFPRSKFISILNEKWNRREKNLTTLMILVHLQRLIQDGEIKTSRALFQEFH